MTGSGMSCAGVKICACPFSDIDNISSSGSDQTTAAMMSTQ